MKTKILILSESDVGGAGIAAVNLAKVLLAQGYQIALAVMKKKSSYTFSHVIQPRYHLFHRLKLLLWHRYLNLIKTRVEYYFFMKDERFSAFSSSEIISSIPFDPDFILVGSTSGFLNFKTIADLTLKCRAKTIFWLADMGSFTGGCHYAWDCSGYKNTCIKCPAIKTSFFRKQASDNLRQRLKHSQRANFLALAGSDWVGRQAAQSLIFSNQKTIKSTNSIVNLDIYNTDSRDFAKSVFQIDSSKQVVFAAATLLAEKRKGFKYLIESMQILGSLLSPDRCSSTVLLLAGEITNDALTAFADLPVQIKYLGLVASEEKLSLAYQASNIFLSTSIQDSGPMMVSQALACGTPVVSFKTGIAADVIQNGFNGYTNRLFDSHGLAFSMDSILRFTDSQFASISLNAQATASEKLSQDYAVSIFESLLNKAST